MPGKPLPLGPRRLERTRGTHGGPLVPGEHREKALDSHDADVGNAPDRRFVHRQERRADGRRAHDPAVEHARHAEVVHVDVPPGALAGHIGSQQRLADDGVAGRGHERRVGIDLEGETAAADERADADASPAAERPDLAVHDREVRGRPVQPRGAEAEQALTRGRGGAPHPCSSAREPGAASGTALVRAQPRVAVHDRDSLCRHAELFRGHLRDRDPHPRSDIDLAGVDRDRAVGVNGEEAVDFGEIERLSAVAGRGGRLGRAGQRHGAECEAHHQRAAGLEQIAARDRRGGSQRRPWRAEAIGNGARRRPWRAEAIGNGARRRLHSAPDARITARRMRVCAPQRQRFRASASFAWSRVGLGVCASSALAAMIMPFVQ